MVHIVYQKNTNVSLALHDSRSHSFSNEYVPYVPNMTGRSIRSEIFTGRPVIYENVVESLYPQGLRT